MKGVVFTEFLSMVADQMSDDMVDTILDDAAPASGGAYTAVGYYDWREMTALVTALSRRTGVPVSDLFHRFGMHLFTVLYDSHRQYLRAYDSALDMLQDIEQHIHVSVRKLYPEAELPTFRFTREDADTLRIQYSSPRPLAWLCAGLVAQCCTHFGEDIQIECLTARDRIGHQIDFLLRRSPRAG